MCVECLPRRSPDSDYTCEIQIAIGASWSGHSFHQVFGECMLSSQPSVQQIQTSPGKWRDYYVVIIIITIIISVDIFYSTLL